MTIFRVTRLADETFKVEERVSAPHLSCTVSDLLEEGLFNEALAISGTLRRMRVEGQTHMWDESKVEFLPDVPGFEQNPQKFPRLNAGEQFLYCHY